MRRSGETALHDRLVWVSGDIEAVDECARELHRSRAMVKKYKARRDSLNPARKLLLQQEENRAEDLEQARPGHHRGGVAGRADVLPGPRHLAIRPWRDVRRRAPPGG